MIWFEKATEFLNTPLHVKDEGDGYSRRKFDMVGSHDDNADDTKTVEGELNESSLKSSEIGWRYAVAWLAALVRTRN